MRERGGFGLRAGQFGFCLGDVKFAADAAFKAALHEPHLLMTQGDGAVHGGDFGVKGTEVAK